MSFIMHTNDFGGLGNVTFTESSLSLPKNESESNSGSGKKYNTLANPFSGAAVWPDNSQCLSGVSGKSGLVQLFIEEAARCVSDAQGVCRARASPRERGLQGPWLPVDSWGCS